MKRLIPDSVGNLSIRNFTVPLVVRSLTLLGQTSSVSHGSRISWICGNLWHQCMRYSLNTQQPIKNEKNNIWKSVSVSSTPDKLFHICLDNRKMKSPSGKILELPTRSLAQLVASEWESQKKVVRPHLLHMTSLACIGSDSLQLSDIERISWVNELIKYFKTDTLLYYHEFPEVLSAKERQLWLPIVGWAKKHFNIQIETTMDISALYQKDAENCLRNYLLTSTNSFELACIERMTTTAKSLLLAIAVREQHISAEDAWNASRVEIDYQLGKWGEVEDSHDVDRAWAAARLSSAACFLQALREP